MSYLLSLFESNSGPTPFQPITTSPHKKTIDRMLFKERTTVKDVWRWLTTEMKDESISYVMLTRYKNARLRTKELIPSAMREEQIRTNLRVLNLIIKRGLETVDKGPAPRLPEVMRALDMRAALLAEFPDASDERVEALRADLAALMELVAALLTDEQRQALRSQVEERKWAFDWTNQ